MKYPTMQEIRSIWADKRQAIVDEYIQQLKDGKPNKYALAKKYKTTWQVINRYIKQYEAKKP